MAAGFRCLSFASAGVFSEGPGLLGKTKKGDDRYSGHFSRLGNFLAHALGSAREEWDPGPTARRLFRERAAIFDLIPYWSIDTSKLDLSRINARLQECVRDWHEVIHAFIDEKRPTAIIVNNCGQPDLIGTMLNCRLQQLNGSPCHMGWAKGRNAESPVLAHPFLGSWRTTRANYINVMRRWIDQVGIDLSDG